MEQKRMMWLDIARGLAMFCIMYGHVLEQSVGPRKWMYSWHVPVFFLITAILLSIKTDWQRMTFRELFIKDLKNILYPYLIFTMIEVIIKGFTISIKDALIGLFHLCILDGLQVFWFLSALFLARQLFFQLMKRTRKKEVIAVCTVIVIIVTSMVSAALRRFDLQNRTAYYSYVFLNICDRSFIGFVFLVLGFAGANRLRSIRLNHMMKGVVLVCMFVFSISLFRYNSVDLISSRIGNPFLFYPLAIAGSVFIFILSDILSHFRVSEIIRFMGCNSIVFLVTHVQVRNLLAFLFPSINREYKGLFFVMLVVIEYGVAWLVIRYLPYLYKFPSLRGKGKSRQPDKA